jgi:hypothetical protein
MIPTGVAAAILGDIGFQRKNWLARFSTFSTVSAINRLSEISDIRLTPVLCQINFDHAVRLPVQLHQNASYGNRSKNIWKGNMANNHMGTIENQPETGERELDEMLQKVEAIFTDIPNATNIMVGRNLNPKAEKRLIGSGSYSFLKPE